MPTRRFSESSTLHNLSGSMSQRSKQVLPVDCQIIANADDVEFLPRESINLKKLKDVFAGWNLALNESKMNNLNIKKKSRIYQAFVKSVLLYGCQT